MPRPLGKRRAADFRAQILQGLQLEAENRLEEADRLYASILAADPRNSYALYRRAIFRAGRGDDLEALRLIQGALKAGATGEMLTDAAVILERLDRLPEAVDIYNRALILNPNDGRALFNRGKLFAQLGQHAKAVTSFEKFLAHSPDHAEGHNFLGHSLIELGRYQAAVLSFNRAIALDPDFGTAHFNLALALLTLGDFETGWAEYERRFGVEKLAPSRSPYPEPHWDGVEDLSGKTILLYTEQGIGDSLMFVRYAPIVVSLGATVIVGVLAPVKTLLSEISGITVVSPGDPKPAFDLQCPLLSLPHLLKTRIDTIPAAVPYLRPRTDRLEIWSRRIPRDRKLSVGVVWAGGRDFKGDRARTIGLAQFVKLFDIPNIRFISLQRELRDGDADILRGRAEVVHFGEALTDFADTAAVISTLDLVISVDTAVAHLAGAMAKPVWILLPAIADFRWMLDREDSPWYPTARLFRQQTPDDWDAAMARVRLALSDLT